MSRFAVLSIRLFANKLPKTNLKLLSQIASFSSTPAPITTRRYFAAVSEEQPKGAVSHEVPSPELEAKAQKKREQGEKEGKKPKDYTLPHPIWVDYQVNDVKVTHKKAEGIVDWMALATVKIMRFNFDLLTGFNLGKRNLNKWLNRIIFLETVAGVPGCVASVMRHLGSLRKMRRDHGWIHTLLEEAENERMHLMTALELKQPGPIFKCMVFLSQGVFFNFFFVSYLFSARFCHRLVGYLEEEAVKTYTQCLKEIDNGIIPQWSEQPAPTIAKNYWRLRDNASMRDVIMMIRADEAHHRTVNHAFASMKSTDTNPYNPGE